MTYIQTPCHEIIRDNQNRYTIRNHETGETKRLDSVESFLLDQELKTCPLGRWDGVLAGLESVL